MSEADSNKGKQRVALVTGATGFVGSHLARHLVREGWQVHILSRAGSRLPDAEEFAHVTNHIHDGSTEGMVRCVAQAKPDVVFHLASLFLSQHATKDVDALIQSNVLFGNQLLEAMKVNEVKYIINTGTSWQHYNNEDYNPVCLYAATKQAFEALLEYYIQACGINAITLKLFDTYGSNDPRPKLFHLLNKAATTGEPLDMSAGEQLIDLVHIDDVVEAYLIAAQRLLEENVTMHETYAVSSGQPLPLKKLVQLYADVTKQTVNVNWGARPYRYREVMMPWSRGAELPNWQATTSLADGLNQTTDVM
jgi:nucleoside-diphosphate-sugar epimerase